MRNDAARTITVLRGLPGSGKTTWARRQLAYHPDTVYISKKDIRKELGIKLGNFDREEEVLAIEAKLIQDGIDRQDFILIDNIHIKPEYIVQYVHLAIENGYSFRLVNFGNVPVAECIRRDALRGDDERVGDGRRGGSPKAERWVITDCSKLRARARSKMIARWVGRGSLPWKVSRPIHIFQNWTAS